VCNALYGGWWLLLLLLSTAAAAATCGNGHCASQAVHPETHSGQQTRYVCAGLVFCPHCLSIQERYYSQLQHAMTMTMCALNAPDLSPLLLSCACRFGNSVGAYVQQQQAV
jgi:hypothetical protein